MCFRIEHIFFLVSSLFKVLMTVFKYSSSKTVRLIIDHIIIDLTHLNSCQILQWVMSKVGKRKWKCILDNEIRHSIFLLSHPHPPTPTPESLSIKFPLCCRYLVRNRRWPSRTWCLWLRTWLVPFFEFNKKKLNCYFRIFDFLGNKIKRHYSFVNEFRGRLSQI